MGKVTGFKEIERKDRSYAPVETRVVNFKEFVIPLSDGDLKDQGARCMDCGIPFCHKGCPVNNLIPDWNDLFITVSGKKRLMCYTALTTSLK